MHLLQCLQTATYPRLLPGPPWPREPVAGLRAGQGGALLCQLVQIAAPNAMKPSRRSLCSMHILMVGSVSPAHLCLRASCCLRQQGRPARYSAMPDMHSAHLQAPHRKSQVYAQELMLVMG